MAFLAAIKKRTDLRAKGVAKEQDDRDPATVTDVPWIGELDPKRFTELPSGGKWMQFYDHHRIWRHWKECQQLYRSGKLEGVSNMKVSTMHPHHSSGVGVIILYCGPPNDEKKVKKIGRNILKETGYTNASKKMFYKTDTQTLQGGKGGFHKFHLDIPQENFENLKVQPSNQATPSNMKHLVDDAQEEKKTHDDDEQQPYTKDYLNTLPKSKLIDIALQLQREINSAPNKSKKPRGRGKYQKRSKQAPVPAPVPAPLPGGVRLPRKNDVGAPIAPPLPGLVAPLPGAAPMPGLAAPLPSAAPIPLAPAPMPGAPLAPLPGGAPAPLPGAAPIAPPLAQFQEQAAKTREADKYLRYVQAIKALGFERAVIIDRKNYQMLATIHKRLDNKKTWQQRIEQQTVLNGRQRLVVLNWFRKLVLERDNIFNYQSNWNFPPYILNIITLHYLENIDDKQQLLDDWCDEYKPCFYFFSDKWNILMREGSNDSYQSLVCLKGKECVIAKQCKTMWIIAKVRIMARKQMDNKWSWMSYQFASAPQAYNRLSQDLFDQLEEEDL